jgi:hypothetical protein
VLLEGDGTRFSLRVLRYQFPAAERGADANWLVIEIDVSLARGSWTATDAALETWDLGLLADWFDRLAAGEDVDAELSFVEPNLSFELVGRADATAAVRIWIEGELRPRWAPYEEWGERDLPADFELSPVALTEAARSLRGELAAFPPRPETA